MSVNSLSVMWLGLLELYLFLVVIYVIHYPFSYKQIKSKASHPLLQCRRTRRLLHANSVFLSDSLIIFSLPNLFSHFDSSYITTSCGQKARHTCTPTNGKKKLCACRAACCTQLQQTAILTTMRWMSYGRFFVCHYFSTKVKSNWCVKKTKLSNQEE